MSYRYYSTQRPVEIGTFPKPQSNKVLAIENFDGRTFCERIGREAWDYIEYEEPLDSKQVRDYELREEGPFYVNKETGEMLSRQAMLAQFIEEYDGDDPTNMLSWDEYYEEVK